MIWLAVLYLAVGVIVVNLLDLVDPIPDDDSWLVLVNVALWPCPLVLFAAHAVAGSDVFNKLGRLILWRRKR